MKIELGVKVGEIKNSKSGVSIAYTNAKGEAQTLDADKLIVSIGRVPNTIGLNAEAVGLQLGERGEIVVDGDCKTNLPGVWAVGDVVRGPMLAHKAEEEGVAVAEAHCWPAWSRQLQHHPWVIYTSPEVAWVGRTEQQLKADGVKYKAGTFPFPGQRPRTRWVTRLAWSSSWPTPPQTKSWACIVGPMASES